MGTRRGRSVAAPSSSEESGPGIESRPPRSPRKPSRKISATAAATGQRAVVETTGNGELEEADSEYNPRAFPYHVKQACWEKAAKVKGRDPDRWRRDALGNIVFRKLVGCPGCLCHDYDHIIPYSKGGKSTLENCQVLQATANRVKSNRTDMSTTDLIQKSAYCRIQGRDMDLIELSAYASVRRGQEPGGCRIQ